MADRELRETEDTNADDVERGRGVLHKKSGRPLYHHIE
jgi:hypothetical protein